MGGCLQATQKRSMERRDLLRTVRYGRDYYEASVDDADLGQTEGNMLCAHRCCGCYPSDDKGLDATTMDDEDPIDANRVDMCSWFSRCFSAVCCGKLFSCQLQVLGVCALAQEGRELDRIVPQHERRFDYVTFQPYVNYYNSIRTLRKEGNDKIWSHYTALSKLSRILLKSLFSFISIMAIIALVVSPPGFQWQNLLVFLGTFLQAFFTLYFVHWHWNRFDISLDAVIKYFACGFAISTTTAIFFELVVSVLMDIVLVLLMIALPLEVVNGDGYEMSSVFGYSPHNMYTAASVSDYKKAFHRDFPYLALIFVFISAYLIAASTEELCKYFGFIIVEHPDFMSQSDLQKAADHGVPENTSNMRSDRDEWGGGLDFISDLDCVRSADSNVSGLYDSFDDENEDSQRNIKKQNQETIGKSNSDVQGGNRGYKSVELADSSPRTIQSIGSAITVAMVSVALGFACCENLIYIFLYNGKDLSMEISVLVSRSMFPVHPLCAAIQSIGVCKQQLENDKSTGLFSALFPAILLHGTYDFSLMVINFILTSKQADGDENIDMLTIIGSIVALVISFGLLIAGIYYYFVQSYKQVRRLAQIEKARTFVGVKA